GGTDGRLDERGCEEEVLAAVQKRGLCPNAALGPPPPREDARTATLQRREPGQHTAKQPLSQSAGRSNPQPCVPEERDQAPSVAVLDVRPEPLGVVNSGLELLRAPAQFLNGKLKVVRLAFPPGLQAPAVRSELMRVVLIANLQLALLLLQMMDRELEVIDRELEVIDLPLARAQLQSQRFQPTLVLLQVTDGELEVIDLPLARGQRRPQRVSCCLTTSGTLLRSR